MSVSHSFPSGIGLSAMLSVTTLLLIHGRGLLVSPGDSHPMSPPSFRWTQSSKVTVAIWTEGFEQLCCMVVVVALFLVSLLLMVMEGKVGAHQDVLVRPGIWCMLKSTGWQSTIKVSLCLLAAGETWGFLAGGNNGSAEITYVFHVLLCILVLL